MADITDPQAIRFINESVRPMAEKVRALKYELASMNVKWSTDIQTFVPNDSSPVVDNREGEGISRLVGTDVNDFMYAVGLISTEINGIAQQSIEKPCVRPLQIN
jgi:hypothetical protein